MPSKQRRIRHRFKVITPFRSLVLCGDNRSEMDDWLGSMKNMPENQQHADRGTADILSGHHIWHQTNHAKPTHCNVCRDVLYGVASQGLTCEVCKYNVHKRCSKKAINNCKWTTLASIGQEIIEDQDGNITMPHQWMEGNLPVSSKCAICDKNCGSVLKLQDWRCLWCKATVHTACRPAMCIKCPLGPAKLSVVPPTALHNIGSDEAWDAIRPTGCSPLLVFVNSKSGDNRGIKFLRRFKQLLNPAQVFDLMKGGPGPGLRLFRHFDPFRILVCSGDGSVGWVLSKIDQLRMHKQCQVGVLPLGTGNDLARVLGWGSSCDDEAHIPHVLEKYEKAGTKMLDRWSIMTFVRSSLHKIPLDFPDYTLSSVVHEYEDSVISHITNILQTNRKIDVIKSAKVLCETMKDFAMRISDASLTTGDQHLSEKCDILQKKLDMLLETLHSEDNLYQDSFDESDDNTTQSESLFTQEVEEKGSLEKPEKDMTNLKKVRKRQQFFENHVVMSRANSLKKAIRVLVEYADQVVDEQICARDRSPVTAPDIFITSDDSDFGERKNDSFDFSSKKFDTLYVDASSPNASSTCSSPTPNVASLSPMPDIRRDSQPEELLTLPAPDGFADSRRNSSNLPGAFTFESDVIGPVTESSPQEKQSIGNNESSDFTLTNTDAPVTVTLAKVESSSSDDTTIQDVMISPDTDSARNLWQECPKADIESKLGSAQCSCSNSIVSSDSLVSDTLDSKRKHSESEIDSDILDSTKKSDSISENNGHIDSPENSEICGSELPNSESFVDDLSSLGQDLISKLGEKYDSVRDCLKSEQMEKPQKFCSLAQFVEGNDIARRSFKRPRYDKSGNKENMFTGKCGGYGNVLGNSNVDNDFINFDDKSTNLLTPVCHFALTSNMSPTKESVPNFPPMISVSVEPPSPSMSVKSPKKIPTDNDWPFRRCSGEMEKLSVELPETGCSPHATRRISSGSLFKGADAVALANLAASAGRFGGSNMSLRHERKKSVDKPEHIKKLPIINPLVQMPMWSNVNGVTGLISKALLVNADALCAAVSPLMNLDETLMEGYFERCVMNNYFGIGIDAKISLDFHQKREEHPEKCRSRTKNYIWYGVLGSKQWLQNTYKNLDQRVVLECDGQRIPLPSLQGIVVLNIPSFMGGTNFWGGTKEGDLFLAPSFDDRILEVVAVFGSVQMAASRLINLQHHRIAQCQSVLIHILGDEGVPVQVDGEAWIQPPGIIRIIHKNRMQMLYRNRDLETSLRAWEEKQRSMPPAVVQSPSSASRTNSLSRHHQLMLEGVQEILSDDEMTILKGIIEIIATLTKWVKLLYIHHPDLKEELYIIAERTQEALEMVHPRGKIVQGASLRSCVTELVSRGRQLYEESCDLLREKHHDLKMTPNLETSLSNSLAAMEQSLRKCIFDEDRTRLVYLQNIPDEQADKNKTKHRGLFWQKFRRSGTHNPVKMFFREDIDLWGIDEVGHWLEKLGLEEHKEKFKVHDIRGRELTTLTGPDLKDLGIQKIGHLKRILHGIDDLKKCSKPLN